MSLKGIPCVILGHVPSAYPTLGGPRCLCCKQKLDFKCDVCINHPMCYGTQFDAVDRGKAFRERCLRENFNNYRRAGVHMRRGR